MKRNVLLVAASMIIAIAVLAALRATAWQLSSKEGGAPTRAPLLERVTPAVVNVYATKTEQGMTKKKHKKVAKKAHAKKTAHKKAKRATVA